VFSEEGQEISNITNEAQELASGGSRGGAGPVQDTIYFRFIRFNSLGGDTVTEEIDFSTEQFFFTGVTVKPGRS